MDPPERATRIAAGTAPRPAARAGTIALAGLLLALLLVAGFVAWALRSEAGTAWLLELLPDVRVTAPQGRLLGEFGAQRVEIGLPRGGAVVIDGLQWSGVRLRRGAGAWQLAIGIERLAASRVDVRPGASDATPLAAPDSLALPFELRIDRLEIGSLTATPLGATPLNGLRAAVELGADGGAQHRVDGLSLERAGLRGRGSARIAARAPFALQAELELQQDGTVAQAHWQATLRARGALEAVALDATLRAEPGRTGAAPQSFDLAATLQPFAAWPLGALEAHAQALDLAAFDPRLPATALSGTAHLASEAMDRPARLHLQLDNTLPGRWNEARLPLRTLEIELAARPDDPGTLALESLAAALGSTTQPAGSVRAQGRWGHDGWSLDARLEGVQPARLDARAAALPFSGPLHLHGSPPAAATSRIELQADLAGRVPQRQGSAGVTLRLDAGLARDAQGERIELREAVARAGGASATLRGSAARTAADQPWRLQGRAQLARFDPLPWWPGREDSPWRQGPHRVDATADFDLAWPAADPGATPWPERLLALRGQAELKLGESLLAGVPLHGRARWHNGDGRAAEISASLESAANRLALDGRFAGRGGSADHWALELEAPALAAFAPVWKLLRPETGDATLAGSLQARAQLDGRWPALASQGEATASALQIDRLTLRSLKANWRAALALDAPVEAQVELAGLRQGPAGVDQARLRLQGSGRAHQLDLQAQLPARPPAWLDALQPSPAVARGTASLVRLQAEGALLPRDGGIDGWRGSVQQLELRGSGADEPAWLRSGPLALEASGLAQAPLRLVLQPGRIELPGAALRWERVAWQAAQGTAPATLEAKAAIDPVAVAPILARLQPDFGWGGDLRVGATLDISSAPSVRADIVLQRERGDLSVTDETGTQALGLSDLRLGLNVADGTWSFTQGLAGSTLGVAAGAFVARTSPQALWPAADAPVSGVLELQVAQLGTWGPWVPPGWRLGGELRVSAGIGGTFGAPEYTGQLRGRNLSVRNFLQGVNVGDGEVAIALQGATARIERFSARAGNGSLQVEGEASFGATPQARLTLAAREFQLLGRVDRRIVASGDAQARLERDRLQLDGRFDVDEGLIDFTRSDAPTLGDDVVVVRGRGADIKAPAGPAISPVRLPSVALDLRVGLGENLRVRGRGLDTRLAGELHVGAPGGRLAVDGTVRAVDGQYAAYGQKLEIDRGELVFNGPAENPRLDIEATRPNLDVRVGVAVTGTAANPRVRLFSEPEMSEIDKLSWLVLGRASDGLGRTDTALLQRAALALLAGEKQGPTDPLLQALGLDEVSVRQSDGEVRETVVSLGKQLSRRWYVGYERSLNATAGSWQLIYRIAQRFTLRAQSGEDSSLDVIWTWRWN